MKNIAVRPRVVLACFLTLVSAAAAEAASIRTLPGLLSVTTYEETFTTTPVAFAPNSSQLTTRLADPLGTGNNDFTFFDQEFYDVFYSNADGTPNADGAFVTVEGVWRNQAIALGGMNINEIELNFAGGVNDFADVVSSVVFGSFCNPGNPAQCNPGSEALAVDHDLSTFPRFGHTSNTDLDDRFRLTVGFNGISDVVAPVPEPSTILLLGSGIAVLMFRRRRTPS